MNPKNLTPQQRKGLSICLGVIVGSYVIHWLVTSASQAANYREQAMRAAQQRARAQQTPPARPVLPSGTASASNPKEVRVPAPAPSDNILKVPSYAGIWRTKTAIQGRGLCTLRLELKEPAPTSYQSYSSLTCVNYAGLQNRPNTPVAVMNGVNPAAAILSGWMEDGSIQLKVDKILGASTEGCAATSFTLTPFGAKELAVEWKEATCAGGHALMQRSGY